MPRVKSIRNVLSGLFGGLWISACAASFTGEFAYSSSGKDAEQRTADLFDSLEQRAAFLRVFLREMPKGGDLHIHLSGTPYAEDYLDWAADTNLCINRQSLALVDPPCLGPELEPARELMTRDPGLYEQVIDGMSVRALLAGKPSPENGHAQFFGSFDRFLPIAAAEPGESMAASRREAASDHVLYQELMYNPATINQYALSLNLPTWNGDLEAAHRRFQSLLPSLIERIRSDLDQAEAEALKALGCETNPTTPGCEVAVRYNCYGLRLIPEAALFHQLALCFALIEADPRFVGVSLVQPEDHPIAVTQYDRHMHMIAFFADHYPSAKVSLHAGELTLGLVAAGALRDHIEKAIHIAGSDRIGHGVDIAFETNSRNTLAHMAAQQIAVEINLSSNAVILGVEADDHPLNLYRASGVPIVLSTDDLGVLRSDMTEQYVLAATEHGLDYRALKTASRNSLYFAFLPGESLWQDASYSDYVADCEAAASPLCESYLQANPKAALELKLERRFEVFENDILSWPVTP